MKKYNQMSVEKKIGELDWGILLSIILLFIIVYIPQSIWMEEKKKICIVFTHHKLGDLIWQIPYIKAISENYNQKIHLIVRKKTQAKDIFKDCDFIECKLPLDKITPTDSLPCCDIELKKPNGTTLLIKMANQTLLSSLIRSFIE